MTDLYMAKAELRKRYEREFDLLCEALDTILSDLQLAKERLARIELLTELQKEKP